MNDDWSTSSSVYELGQFLVQRGAFNHNVWRLFHCRCLRRGWHLISDERVKRAIELAESYARNEASVEELDAQNKLAESISAQLWNVVLSMRLSQDDSEYNWPVSDDRVDDAWVQYSIAEGAKVVTRKQIDAFDTPEAACATLAWATARHDVLAKGGKLEPEVVLAQWKANRDAEERQQVELLRSMFPITSSSDSRGKD
jgi:hypothetical protein